MLSVWEHFNPVRVRFGRGCRGEVATELQGHHCLIVASPRGRRQIESDLLLVEAISGAKSSIWMDAVEPNPDLVQLQEAVVKLRDTRVSCVLAFGGGSSIDSAKALALGLSPAANNRTLRDLIDIVACLPLGASLPLYTLPTTAGTGSEVTPYATLWDHRDRCKLSLAGPSVYPHSAYVDPELTDTLPYSSTLHTGLDAINQAAESIWNHRMTPVSEALAHRALKVGLDALPRLLDDLNNMDLRDLMAEVSLLAGMAISQTRTSLCHAISYPLTAHFGIPHGLACAFTMPAVLRLNLTEDDGRFQRLAKVLAPEGKRDVADLLYSFDAFNRQLNVAKQIRNVVGTVEALFVLRDQMVTLGRADNVLVNVDSEVLQAILEWSWES